MNNPEWPSNNIPGGVDFEVDPSKTEMRPLHWPFIDPAPVYMRHTLLWYDPIFIFRLGFALRMALRDTLYTVVQTLAVPVLLARLWQRGRRNPMTSQ